MHYINSLLTLTLPGRPQVQANFNMACEFFQFFGSILAADIMYLVLMLFTETIRMLRTHSLIQHSWRIYMSTTWVLN